MAAYPTRFTPEGNIKGFTLHTALKPLSPSDKNCPGSFDAAYARDIYKITHSTAPKKFRHDNTAWNKVTTKAGAKDDAYEVFSKAIAGYNGGTGFWKKGSWSNILKRTRKSTQLEIKNGKFENSLDGKCFSCLYSIQVKNEKYGLPYRQYLWLGGKYPASHPTKAGQDWCFAYGEEEWVDPSFQVPDQSNPSQTVGASFEDYKNQADLNDNFKLACN